MLSTPKRSTNTRATRVISSKERISSRASHAIPSSGMQYVQRKLQRSVTEIRRSRWTRPNPSTSCSGTTGPAMPRPRYRCPAGGAPAGSGRRDVPGDVVLEPPGAVRHRESVAGAGGVEVAGVVGGIALPDRGHGAAVGGPGDPGAVAERLP